MLVKLGASSWDTLGITVLLLFLGHGQHHVQRHRLFVEIGIQELASAWGPLSCKGKSVLVGLLRQ